MPRVSDLGISIGLLPPGPAGSVLDVPGVGLGHATVWRDEPPPPAGRGVARTGVTVLDPGGDLFSSPVPAGGAVLNGAGECTGLLAAREWGLVETPVFLTSTMQVGRVYDAACELLAAEQPAIGTEDVIIPVVAECDDSFLNDARRMQVGPDDVRAALRAARGSVRGPVAGSVGGSVAGSAGGSVAGFVGGSVAGSVGGSVAGSVGGSVAGSVGGSVGLAGQAAGEGAVGAGTGMSCLGYKGGIGTASRVLPDGRTVGVLALTNFGVRQQLTVAGVPVGRLLPDPAPGQRAAPPTGSCIVVLITDGRLDSAACNRVARRAGLGLARTGSTGHHASGEIFLALATGLRAPRGQAGAGPPVTGTALDGYFDAATEATEEAVINSMLQAETVTGRDGNTSYQLPAADVRRLVAGRAGR